MTDFNNEINDDFNSELESLLKKERGFTGFFAKEYFNGASVEEIARNYGHKSKFTEIVFKETFDCLIGLIKVDSIPVNHNQTRKHLRRIANKIKDYPTCSDELSLYLENIVNELDLKVTEAEVQSLGIENSKVITVDHNFDDIEINDVDYLNGDFVEKDGVIETEIIVNNNDNGNNDIKSNDRSGVYVYSYPWYIENPDKNGRVLLKIGASEKGVSGRIDRQKRQTEIPEDVELLRSWNHPNPFIIEERIHNVLKELGLHYKTKRNGSEWYLTHIDAVDAIAKTFNLTSHNLT